MTAVIKRAMDWARHRARARSGNPAHVLGRRGEDLAHRYLQRQGIVVVARNWRAQPGGAELDIVGRAGETLVIVEVKSRASEEFGAPDRAVGEEKQKRIFLAAVEFARRAGIDRQMIRFDLVNVVFNEPVDITHLIDVVSQRTQSGLRVG